MVKGLQKIQNKIVKISVALGAIPLEPWNHQCSAADNANGLARRPEILTLHENFGLTRAIFKQAESPG